MEISTRGLIKGIILSFVILTGINFNAAAQCTFGKGDLVFTGYDLQDGGTSSGLDDRFSFVLLRQIPAGTEILFTDLGWTSANDFQAAAQATTDGVIKWTAEKTYPAGTEIYIFCKYQLKAFDKLNAPAGTVTGVQETAATQANPPGGDHQYMSLGLFSGDQIFAFTGTIASPVFIAGISMNHDTGLNNSGWDTNLSPVTFAADRSMLPLALQQASVQNLSIISHADGGDPTFNTAYTARYKKTSGGITIGNLAGIVSLINNKSNWEVDDLGNHYSPFLAGEQFIVPLPSITTNPADRPGICASLGTTFTAAATDFCSLKWQVSTDQGLNFTDLTDAGVYTGSATATLTISNVNGLDNYRYRLNATGASGSASSAIAFLTLGSQVISLNPVLAAGTYKTNYSQQVAIASGGAAPYNYTVSPATLPPGLTLSSTGLLSGVPTASGSYTFTVSVTGGCISSGSQSYTLVIAPKVLTATYAAVSKVYNGNPAAVVVFNAFDAAAGLATGDVVSLGYTTAVYNDANVGTAKAVTFTGLALSGLSGANYTLNPVAVTGNITAVPIVPSLILPVTKAYDGNTNATLTSANYSFTGKIGTDDVALNNPVTGTYALKNAGSHVVTVSGLTLTGTAATNYTLSTATVTATGTITAAVITPSLTGTITKVYDGNITAALTGANYNFTGKVGVENVALNNPVAGTYDLKNAGNRIVSVSGLALTGTDAANYSLSTTSLTGPATITAATIIPVLTGTINKIYDGNTAASLTPSNYSFTGKIGTENVALNNPLVGNYDLKTAGSRAVTVTGIALTGTDAGNYSLSTTSLTTPGNIAAVTVLPVLSGNITKIYDGNTVATLTPGNYSVAGKLGADDVALNNPVTGTYDLKPAGNRTVTVSGLALTGTDAVNYILIRNNATAPGTITAATITPALAGTLTKVYDGNITAALTGANYSFTGKVGLDNINLNNPVTGSYDLKDAGSRTVSVNGLALTGTDAANYSLSTTSLTAPGTITAATITPVLSGTITKVYDGNTTAALTAANYSFTGKIGTEAVVLNSPSTGTYAVKNIGNRVVTVNGLALTGADAANYSLSTTSLTAPGTITVATITPVLAGPITKVYDGNTTAILNNGNYSLTGNIGSENVALNNPSAGTYDQKDAGNRTVTVNGITLTGTDAANYSLSATSLTAPGTITSATIIPVLSGTISKVYDGNTTAALSSANYSFTGKVAADNVVLNNPVAGTYDLKNAGSRTVSVNGLALTGTNASNYSLSTTSLTAPGSITTASITPMLAGTITKVYDGNTTAALTAANYSFTGKVAGEDVTLNRPAMGTYDHKNVATGKTVTVTGIALQGTDAANYILAATTLNTNIGTITAQPLTITADNKQMVQGTTVPVLTLKYSGFINGEDERVLTASASLSTTGTSSSVAGNYPVVLSGARADNYAISFVNGVLTIIPGVPAGVSFAATALYENQPAGALAGTLSSTSLDPNATFTYTLVSGSGDTDNNLFSITGNQVRTTASLSFVQKSVYSINVRSTTQYGLTLDKQFTINLIDVNEVPTLNPIADLVQCNTTARQTIALTGISAGPETNQTTTLTVRSDQPNLFSELRVSQNGADKGTLTYRLMDNTVSGTVKITVTVKDNGGTANGGVDTYSRTFALTINPLPVISIVSSAGTEISKGITTNLTATGGSTYVWSNALGIIGGQNTAVLTVRPAQTTTYTVTAVSSAGCSSSQQITITVNDDYKTITATNILTPNGDGVNDVFVIRNIDMYPNNEVKIFDRSGRLIYSKKSYDNTWDGTLSGNPLAEGTYFYVLDFGNSRSKHKGFITLVRNN